mmetsp:Transcript_33983/g.79139  ORF Transcript_33983/g.79139 Transcript_33983/m.79139 type:complete len:217 (-) Transcript_33983:728-1378(-)
MARKGCSTMAAGYTVSANGANNEPSTLFVNSSAIETSEVRYAKTVNATPKNKAIQRCRCTSCRNSSILPCPRRRGPNIMAPADIKFGTVYEIKPISAKKLKTAASVMPMPKEIAGEIMSMVLNRMDRTATPACDLKASYATAAASLSVAYRLNEQPCGKKYPRFFPMRKVSRQRTEAAVHSQTDSTSAVVASTSSALEQTHVSGSKMGPELSQPLA